MQPTRTKPNRNKINLVIDLAIFVAFLIAMSPHFSGIAVHEWLSIAFGAAIIAHLLLHWEWIVGITRSFFKKARWSARSNYVLNVLLFIDITIVIFTGLMISEDALPLFGIQTIRGGIWHGLHSFSADLSLVLVGLHIALHWEWIVKMFKRFVLTPLLPRRLSPQMQLTAQPPDKKVQP
ncbi:MAG: DUF4405 domain-containing protein [Chloroflexi bacterium]|nr:DUF4405 domain-containing protein [Chloroflexota bacterium]